MRVSATEFARNFSRYQDEAREQPIEVTSHDRTTGYFVSPRDFKELQELRARERRSLVVGRLSRETRDAIRSSKMSPEHAHLDDLMDE